MKKKDYFNTNPKDMQNPSSRRNPETEQQLNEQLDEQIDFYDQDAHDQEPPFI